LAVLYCQLNPLSFSMSKTELVDEPVNWKGSGSWFSGWAVVTGTHTHKHINIFEVLIEHTGNILLPLPHVFDS
jgi:hypothetical protein